MPWTTPTLRDLRKTNRDNLAAYLPGADATVPNSVLRVLSDQNAAGAYLNLLYLDWLSRQFLPDTAESEWLDRHGQIWLGGRKGATFAVGVANVTGTQGILLPSGTPLAASDGTTYQTTADVYLSQSATPVGVECLTPGSIGNRDAGALLTLQLAVAGVDAQATAAQISGGTDVESDDELRTRVLLRIRNTPMGGDATDYVQWALSVPGVTRAWVAPLEMGIGTVTVRFMADDLRASSDGFPADADIAAVRAYLDTVRPVAVKDFFVAGPIPYPLTMTVRNLSNDTPSVRIAIETAVRDMLYARAAPGQTVYRSWVDEAISGALGEDHHDLDFANAVMPAPGYMATLQTILYA